MQIEVDWHQDEQLRLKRDQHPHIFHAIKQCVHPKFSSITRLFIALMIVGTCLALLGAAVYMLLDPIIGGLGLLICLFIFWLLTRDIREQRHTHKGFLSFYNGQRHTYEPATDGLIQHAPGSTLHTPWPSIATLCINDQWLVLTKRDYHMLIIPRRAFESDGELESFLLEVESRAGIERIAEKL